MKASILLITYGHEQYIGEAIRSILAQKRDFEHEIIVLDDHSPDATFSVASEALKLEANVTLLRNETNLGITKNYQKGFSLCRGEFVFVLEGDDYWLDTEKMAKQISFLETHPFHSMCFHPYLFQEDSSRVFRHANKLGQVPIEHFSIRDLIINENLVGNFSICCYRNEFLKKIPEAVYAEISYDWMINLCMGEFGLMGKINEEMSVYRLSKDSIWSTQKIEQQIQHLINLIPIYDQLLGYRYSSLFEEKSASLKVQIASNSSPNLELIKSWLPPIIPQTIKLFVPTRLKK